ncbi:MAG: TadE/TadG family type IV pilus assembly protein [Rickettsiales bacterium]
MTKNRKNLIYDAGGMALVEFAILLPILLVLFFGSVEVARYIIGFQKFERATYSVSNIMTQYLPITYKDGPLEIDLDAINNEIIPQFGNNMEGYSDPLDRIILLSSISKTKPGGNNDTITVNWQVAGGGDLANADTRSILNGANAIIFKPSLNGNGSDNGIAAGSHPTFPTFSGQPLMNGALSGMEVGENMLIVEAFYKYEPIASKILGGLGVGNIGEHTMKSVIYSRPRNGDLLTLVRPAPPSVIPGPVHSWEGCYTIDKPYNNCTTTGTPETGTQTVCWTCTGEKYCQYCTITFASPDDTVGSKVCNPAEFRNRTGCTSTTTQTPGTGTGSGGGGDPYPPPSEG